MDVSGRQIGQYRVVRVIGEGAVGTVYEVTGPQATAEPGSAQSGMISSRMALKWLHPHLVGEPEPERSMLHEFELAGRFTHRGLVRAYDHIQSEGRGALVMELVHGASLLPCLGSAAWRRASANTRQRFVRHLITQLGSSLHALHELRDDEGARLEPVHGDVCPANVLVPGKGPLRLIDLSSATSRLRPRAAGRGVAGYVAPECLSEARPMRPSADIWSLGVLAWEMVMGERLFLRGSEALTIKAVVEDHVPEVAAECDPELRSTIMRMLNRDPALRPSAQELEALTRGGRDVDDVAALQAMF